MIDRFPVPERFIRNHPTCGKCRKEAKALAFGKVLGAVVSEVYLGEVSIVEGISQPSRNALLPEWQVLDGASRREVYIITLVVQHHGRQVVGVECPLEVDLTFHVNRPVSPVSYSIAQWLLLPER